MRTQLLTVAFCCCAVIASTGCNRAKPETTTPAEATVKRPVVPQNQEMTVTGCLRAGESTDTFVLTTAQTRDSAETATYQLSGTQGVNLRDHIGKRVEVNGVVRSEQEVASSSPSRPAAGSTATGTAGTPTVQTSTQLQVRQDGGPVRQTSGRKLRIEARRTVGP